MSKAIDKAARAEREVVGTQLLRGTAASSSAHIGNLSGGTGVGARRAIDITAPATPEAVRWQGWGTALKPAFEPVIVARKPFPTTVAANVQEWGTGALNIDGCRIGTDGGARVEPGTGGFDAGTVNALGGHLNSTQSPKVPGLGRWPANVALDETQAEALDQQSGESSSYGKPRPRGDSRAVTQGATRGGLTGGFNLGNDERTDHGDQGGASRFFYTAKADSNERPRVDGVAHPTVKSLNLMRWLVRLVTPPGGKVLDPFAGSGTTGEAALLEGFLAILIERETDYLPLIVQRIHRRLNPVEAIRQTGGDLGLFGEPT